MFMAARQRHFQKNRVVIGERRLQAICKVASENLRQTSTRLRVTQKSIFAACVASGFRNAADFAPPRIPGHLSLVFDGGFPFKDLVDT